MNTVLIILLVLVGLLVVLTPVLIIAALTRYALLRRGSAQGIITAIQLPPYPNSTSQEAYITWHPVGGPPRGLRTNVKVASELPINEVIFMTWKRGYVLDWGRAISAPQDTFHSDPS